MLPENKAAAVKKAITATFGTPAFDSIEQITKGLSTALVYKITVDGMPYLLRIVTRTDAIADPGRYFGAMELAAKASVAPPVYYLDAEERISITGFVQEQMFSTAQARATIPVLLRQLHALPAFAYRINYFTSMEAFIEKFLAAGIMPASITQPVFTAYNQIARVYPMNKTADWVACHNDVKPENIVFDGIRPWLVDWESAFLNDPYLDLAMMANFVVNNESDELAYLGGYFGQPATSYQHARLFLMRQLLHVYYFTFCMLSGSQGKKVTMEDIETPGFTDYHQTMWKGALLIRTNEAKIQYALVHMKQFLGNIGAKKWEASLQVVANHGRL